VKAHVQFRRAGAADCGCASAGLGWETSGMFEPLGTVIGDPEGAGCGICITGGERTGPLTSGNCAAAGVIGAHIAARATRRAPQMRRPWTLRFASLADLIDMVPPLASAFGKKHPSVAAGGFLRKLSHRARYPACDPAHTRRTGGVLSSRFRIDTQILVPALPRSAPRDKGITG